jgi:hypothetical protein
MDNQVTNLHQTVHIHASKQNINELQYPKIVQAQQKSHHVFS